MYVCFRFYAKHLRNKRLYDRISSTGSDGQIGASTAVSTAAAAGSAGGSADLHLKLLSVRGKTVATSFDESGRSLKCTRSR